MKLNRSSILFITALVFGVALVGCSSNEPAVDAPLVKDAGEPPPQPNKLTPSTGGKAPANEKAPL